MKLTKAIGIFHNIDSDTYTDEEKGAAVLRVCKMATHNSITKAAMLKVIWWLLNLAFEVEEETP